MIFVQQSACRLFRALFELSLKQKWASLSVKILEFCIMIERKIWSSQSPLRQFTTIPEVLLRKLEKMSDVHWSTYYDLSPNDLGEIIKVPKMGKTLYKFVHMIPKLLAEVRAFPLSRSLLKLDIGIAKDFDYNDQLHGPVILFWVMIEDADGENILHYEPLLVKNDVCARYNISCTVPLMDPLAPQYFIRIIADRWLHSNTVIPISFKHLILPEKFSPPTVVLDLSLLPTATFQDNRMRDYFSHYVTLNSVQTQTFYSLFESNDNVLICAPTGIGKTACAELAILRNFLYKTGKCVYINPNQVSISPPKYQRHDLLLNPFSVVGIV